MCTNPTFPLVDHLRAQAENKDSFLRRLKATPRKTLKAIWDVAGIDDESQDPDPWPCFCGQIWGCQHSLDVRLKGMLARLSERQALTFLKLQGITDKTTPRKRKQKLGKFFAGVRRRRRSENPILAWHFALVFDLPADRCEDFLYSLKIVTITYLDRLFRRPPVAARRWYLPIEAARTLLGRFSPFVEPPPAKHPSIVCPGKPKVSLMASRRGEGTDNDSAEARANGRLGAAVFRPGDLVELPKGIGRKTEHLGNGATLAGSIGLEARIKADYAAAAAERTTAA